MTKRANTIKASAIRKVFDKAASIKDVINLSIGQPDFAVPEVVKEGMIEAIKNNKTGYTPSAGIPTLREKILAKYTGKSGMDSVIITSGASGGIFLSYSVLLEEGEELIVFAPYFVMYPDLANFLNIKPVIVKTNSDFSLNFENLKAAISSKTKAIIINSPNNPTGYVLSKEELEKVIEIARENDLWVISDEIYADFNYDGEFVSMAGLYDKTIILSGFSKNLAMTGLRVGYAVGPKEVIDDMVRVQQYSYVCAPSIAQYGIDTAWDKINIEKELAEFKWRRDFVYESLKDVAPIIKPGGGFYMFIKLPEGISTDEFIDKCLEQKLLVVPGYAFMEEGTKDNYIRISYAVSRETLERGMIVLKSLLKR